MFWRARHGGSISRAFCALELAANSGRADCEDSSRQPNRVSGLLRRVCKLKGAEGTTSCEFSACSLKSIQDPRQTSQFLLSSSKPWARRRRSTRRSRAVVRLRGAAPPAAGHRAVAVAHPRSSSKTQNPPSPPVRKSQPPPRTARRLLD